jgi:hypothetical protein
MNDFAATLRFALHLLGDSSQRRHFMRWLTSRCCKNYSFKKRLPWLTFDAIDYLDRMNLKGARVFEYGSGCSTLYWQRRGADFVSIEHDPAWYEKMRSHFDPTCFVDYRLVPVDPEIYDEPWNPADPDACSTDWRSLRGRTFRTYVSSIDSFDDGYFDVILIDGRSRPSCMKHSIPKLKAGGIMILDNADREHYYRETKPLLTGWEILALRGVDPMGSQYSRTDILKKPGGTTTNGDSCRDSVKH